MNGATYLFETAVHDTNFVATEFCLFAQIFKRDCGMLVDSSGADFKVALLDRGIRGSSHVFCLFPLLGRMARLQLIPHSFYPVRWFLAIGFVH